LHKDIEDPDKRKQFYIQKDAKQDFQTDEIDKYKEKHELSIKYNRMTNACSIAVVLINIEKSKKEQSITFTQNSNLK
jgi:hypothetical protein